MATPARVSLTRSVPAPAFAPLPGHTYRVSLAWWEPGPDGRPEPYLLPAATAAAQTVVVVWPTDAQGRFDVAAARDGHVEVTTWDLSDAHLDQLRALSEYWPLERDDLYVTADSLGPARTGLRHTDFWSVVHAQVEAAIRACTQPVPSGRWVHRERAR